MPRGENRLTTETFIEKVRAVHGSKFDYTKVVYVNNKTKVAIGCPDHGDFTQIPNNHLNDHGCPRCKFDKLSRSFRCSVGDFVKKARAVHGDKYDYSKVVYLASQTNVIIGCPDHGDFEQRPGSHLDQAAGCPMCSESHGEKTVAEILQQSGVDFDREFRLPDCRDKLPLPFDFVAWGKDGYPRFIEYQGQQHYTGWDRDEEQLRSTQRHDAIKAAFCRRMNIPLLVIHYQDKNRVPELVQEFTGGAHV